MANFLAIVDPDRDRRLSFCKAAQSRLDFLGGLAMGDCACGDFQALWACGVRAPVQSLSDEGAATVAWGTLIREDGRRVTAQQLAAEWSRADGGTPPIYDGYYGAVRYDRRDGLVVGADLIGMFPIFWWQSGDVLLVGSSPELFKLHPLFRFALDPAGLVGILLLAHCADGRTLMSGVQRLGAGKALTWNPGAAAREVVQYEIPVSRKYFDQPFSATVELVNDAFHRAVARHVPADETYGMTLSGGRDSRMLAGTMAELDRPPIAMTVGDPSDFELKCAAATARTLGFDHRTTPMNLDDFERFAELHATWTHCCTGFNLIAYWSWLNTLRTLPPYVVAALGMDFIVGGSHVDWGYSNATHRTSFATFFARVNAPGIAADRLHRFLRPQIFGTHLDDVLERLQAIYDGYPGSDAQRAWCFDAHHRLRFYTATLPYQFSFASWPITPSIDREMLEITSGIAPGVLSERRVEDAILRAYFPDLAALPLDRNSHDTTPLEPRLRYRILRNLQFQMKPIRERLPRLRQRKTDPRIYYRVFEFNGPGWKGVRRLAEPHRHKLYELFDRSAVDAILPAPDVDLRVADGISDYSGPKLLVELALWAARNL